MMFNKKGEWSWKIAGIIIVVIFLLTMLFIYWYHNGRLKEVAYALNRWWRYNTFA